MLKFTQTTNGALNAFQCTRSFPVDKAGQLNRKPGELGSGRWGEERLGTDRPRSHILARGGAQGHVYLNLGVWQWWSERSARRCRAEESEFHQPYKPAWAIPCGARPACSASPHPRGTTEGALCTG